MAKLFSLLPKTVTKLKQQLTTLMPKTPICGKCFKTKRVAFLDIFSPLFMCEKCFNEFDVIFAKTTIEGTEVLTIYQYNEALKTTLYHLKALNDIALASVFLERHRFYLRLLYRGYVIVPAPSSENDDKQRGFNHVQAIFACLKCKVIPLIEKKHDFKQSDLNYAARQKVSEKLKINGGEALFNKHVLIVDDIKTSGATLKAMINLIMPFKPKKLKVLTIGATKLNT